MFNKISSQSEFRRNILTLMTGTTIAQAIPIAITPILTRLYTPEDFGIFALFIAIIGLFSSVASGRYELAIMIPKKDEDAINILSLGFLIVLFFSLISLILILVFFKNITNLLRQDDIFLWIYILPISIFLTGLFNLLTYYNNRKKNYKDIANATILKSIILSVSQLLIGMLSSGVMGLISGHILSQLFANLKLCKNILLDKVIIKKVSKLKMLALAKKYKNFPKFQVVHAVISTLSSNLPIYIFSLLFNTIIVGYYSLSARIVLTPLMILSGASAKVYNQRLTILYNEKGDMYSFTIRLLKSLFKKIVIPFILLITFAPTIFSILFGESWKEAGVYTQILSPWLFLVFFASLLSFVSSLLNLQKRALFLDIIHFAFRLIALSIGVVMNNIYVALILFSIVGFCMLLYNINWILLELKKRS